MKDLENLLNNINKSINKYNIKEIIQISNDAPLGYNQNDEIIDIFLHDGKKDLSKNNVHEFKKINN